MYIKLFRKTFQRELLVKSLLQDIIQASNPCGFLGAGTAYGVLKHPEYINKTLFNCKTGIITVSAELRIDVFEFINDERGVDAVIAFNSRI